MRGVTFELRAQDLKVHTTGVCRSIETIQKEDQFNYIPRRGSSQKPGTSLAYAKIGRFLCTTSLRGVRLTFYGRAEGDILAVLKRVLTLGSSGKYTLNYHYIPAS